MILSKVFQYFLSAYNIEILNQITLYIYRIAIYSQLHIAIYRNLAKLCTFNNYSDNYQDFKFVCKIKMKAKYSGDYRWEGVIKSK